MNRFWKLAFVLPSATMVNGSEAEAEASTCLAALSQARALKAPEAASVNHGEMEGIDFWYDNAELLEKARLEWGRKHTDLYHFDNHFIEKYLNEDIKDAVNRKSIAKLESLFMPTEKEGVYKIQLFTPKFATVLLEELAHQEAAGIPIRRPNGMNRYGCILDQIGFDTFVKNLSETLLRPMVHALFPDRVALEDTASQYGFVVQYHPNADVNLAQHADASTMTINVCLEPSKEQSPLYFSHVREVGVPPPSNEEELQPTNVTLDAPGMAVIHLGQHLHGVSNVTSARSNMVIWLHGDYGYVRVAPYEQHEVPINRAEWTSKLGWN